MWPIIIPLVGGYIFSVKKAKLAARLPIAAITNVSLVLLLLVMGARIGADSEVIIQIVSLGFQAFLFAWATVIGSVAVLWIFQFWLKNLVTSSDAEVEVAGGNGGFTLMLLASVLGGIGLGFLLPEAVLPLLAEATTWVLGLLLLGIGLDLGLSAQVFANLRSLGLRVVLLPIGIIIGSILGAVVLVLFWDVLSWHEAGALASGFGWYSLSSVIISEVHSPVLGAMAFIANVFRELIAIIFTPLIARRIGKIASLAPAGATAMDVLLPVIAKGTGREYVPLAFFTGAVLSISVAFFVNLFLSLG